jgi:subtilisin family serine protease
LNRPTTSSILGIAAAVICAAMAGAVPASGAEISSDVLAAAGQSGAQRVFVHFENRSEGRGVLGTTKRRGDSSRLEATARAIAVGLSAVDDVVAAGDLAIDRVFRLQPTVSATVTIEGLEALANRPGVVLVELDRRLEPQTLEGLEVIGAGSLHQMNISGEGTAIAVIDTGVDYNHPTLGGGQIPNAKVIYGLDTADGDDDPMDCLGHGTAVASVAAGSSYQWSPNRRFAGGVAPAAKILAYKVTEDDDCRTAFSSAVVAAIEDAVLHRNGDGYTLAAINISLGGGEFSSACDDANAAYAAAIQTAVDAGITVVAAAGNNGFTDALSVPGCLTNTISVGSAWDEDTGALPFRFCLDAGCQRTCDDSLKHRRSVACYSNSSPFLDLVAPSEFLKAAAANSVTIDFGGTSGAAAYVTGAAALLNQALGDIGPTTVKFLLASTGVPSMDDKSGLIRSVIDLEAAVDAVDDVVISAPISLRIPPLPDAPISSSIVVDHPGEVGSLKVHLNLVHPEPEHMRITLEAPSGARVVLHDRNDGVDGISGVYPDDLRPVESLGRLSGLPRAGLWFLEIEDLRQQASGPEKVLLVNWALEFAEPTHPRAEDTTMIFPVVAHTEGALDTSWRSDLRIFNPIASRSAEVRLHLLPPSGDESFDPRQTDVIIPHGSVVSLDDIVKQRFGFDDAQGSLVVQDQNGTTIHATSRTFTTNDRGTYGQFVAPEVAGVGTTGAGDPALVVLPNAGPDHRVNIGVTEITGDAATVAMTLIDSDNGVAIGSSTFFEVAGFSNIQLNQILPDLELGAVADPYVALTVVQGEGRIAAYGSIIDNLSGDAVFVRGATPQVTPYLLVPVVARTEGLSGTQWRSDLRVLNHGSFSIHVDAELRFQGSIGLPSVVESFELQPGQAVTLDDVVQTLFGYDSAVGSLRLVPREGPAAICATSRTANHGGSSGTYGQYVPAVTAGGGVVQGVLLHVDKGPNTRSNLGLVETDGQSVGIEIRLLDEVGRPLGSFTRMTLGPWESVQLNDIFSILGADDRHNSRIELVKDSGGGSFFAYASVIDAESGDAIFVPVQDLNTR